MGLKILAAGCSKEDRERVEHSVKAVLGERPAAESWAVSLVKTRGKWSVTVDGPDNRLRGFTFLSSEPRLSASLTEALQGAGFLGPSPSGSSPSDPSPSGPSPSRPPRSGPPPPMPASAPRSILAGERRDRHECGQCGKPFVVLYEAQANESQETVSVACPHCWERNVVSVGQWAATGRDYRAEKVNR
jgi:DNA-directed RNA polymerase subunit RPC12/RpoP